MDVLTPSVVSIDKMGNLFGKTGKYMISTRA